MKFAEQLALNIQKQAEINRLQTLFSINPDNSIETSLSYAEATELGFVVSTSYQGTYVSLPNMVSSQYGDH